VGNGYKGLPGADKVSIRIYADANAQLTSTQAGEVDFQYFRKPTSDQLKQLSAIPGMTPQKALVGLNIFYSFNLGDDQQQPPNAVVKKKEFRQASVWALDRHTLCDDVLGGVFKVPDIMNHWIVPWANSDKLVKYDPQDVDKAKSLLQAAGYNGEEIQVYNFPKPDPDFAVILSMWQDAGIKTKAHEFGADTFFDEFYTAPKYDIGFAYGFGTISGLPWTSDQFLSSKFFPQKGGLNAMRFANAEWDKEFAAALAAPDQASQTPHLQRASEIFNDELPYVALYQRVDYTILSDKLRGPEKAPLGILHPNQSGVNYWEWYIAS